MWKVPIMTILLNLAQLWLLLLADLTSDTDCGMTYYCYPEHLAAHTAKPGYVHLQVHL